ncbi:NlpC/P60 family protein [Maricaulis maris]|uniref:NlpC/P60 family putative phage cell wall peptidase n=1 Tax=Maricaulis maris TaxID=74318 RepID=A0A495D194_9PROT|nr:NlpC/P60 family protein [Maricaulis maris]RKQ95256.1 NlpC/P60 family putative phage cell wall peptidase [Maricaulis maris]
MRRAKRRRPVSARALALAEARRWIGTPYHHRASCRGAGCDCLGLLRGIWRALNGAEPQAVPAYERDLSDGSWDGALLAAARRHFCEIDKQAVRPGDVLLFAVEPGGAARHCAVLSQRGRIIHAYWHRSVVETALTPWWRRRLVAAFAFPDLPDTEPSEEAIWPILS